MGTWEEESRELLEPQNEINKDVSSDETHHDENDVGVRVEVEVGDNNGDVDGEECRVRVSAGVDEEAALVRQLERVEIQKNGSDDSKFEEYDEEEEYQDYPLRPHAEDCSFYVRTGTCKFGQTCRYNHPPKGGSQPVGDSEKGIEEGNGPAANIRKVDCKYFQSPGGCKYGDACRYNHSTHTIERECLEHNFIGLPIRPSTEECTFYLRNGSCGYGANCRFNHPDYSSAKGNSLANVTSTGGIGLPRNYAGGPLQPFGGVSQGTQGLPTGLNVRNGSPYASEMSSYNQALRPNPGWNQNQVNNGFPASKTPLPHQVANNFSKRVDPSVHYENLMQIGEFPERPGQPDCDYFMKTGNCKYGPNCRYNHPITRAPNLSLPPVSSMGLYSRPATIPAKPSELFNSNPNKMRENGMSSAHHRHQQPMQIGVFPERPGQPECEYYMKTGQCKFNSACKYHHPRIRLPTSSHCAISKKGLPIRTGAKLCRNYEQEGTCKYGINCLFNHPDDHLPADQAAAQFHNPTNADIGANLDPPAGNYAKSDWDDGWGM